MEENDLDFEELFSLVSKYSENGQIITGIDSMDFAHSWSAEKEPTEDNKTIKEYLDSEMGSEQETETKKLMALTSILSGDERSPMEIAADVDMGVTYTKAAYKVGTGELDVLEATDIVIDKAATRLNAFLQQTLNPEIVGEVVGEAVAFAFPPARFVKPVIKAVVKRCVPEVRRAISYGVKTVANAAKSVVRGSATWLSNKVKKLAQSLA